MRAAPFLVMAVTACASSATTGSGGSAGSLPVHVEGTSNLAVNAAPVAGVSVIAAPIDKAWLALAAVYDSLAIPRSRTDAASHSLGISGMQIRRRLGNVRLSRYLDCGMAQQGPSADDYDVNLSVSTQLQPDATGGTRVTTTVGAMAKPIMISGDYSRCSSTGEIELRVHKLLAAAMTP
jgi:hypothetical protein